MRRLTLLALTACAAAGLAAPSAADAKRVRVFAVGPKFSLDWVESRSTYHDKLFALTDRDRRGGGAPVIQQGADDVASHLLGPTDRGRAADTARDLVTLPEDIGLFAAFTGSRGAGARAITPSTGGLVGAVASLIGAYGPVSAYYSAKYPSLGSRGIPTRLLAISLTDQFVRVGVETFAELADRYDVYLEAGVNMARSWRVVCVSRATYRPPPGAGPCEEENPALVAQLRSPDEPTRDYAYEATTDVAQNMALLFDPDGRLVVRQAKEYLTPIELPPNLDLVPGHGTRAFRTPVGTLGFVTSKDAWMPDLTARLDQLGVDLLVQPEFFVGDTVDTSGMWAPDNLKASGYSDVLRHPSMEAMVLPELTGNVYDFSADAQQHIVVKPRSARTPRGFLVGQPTASGFAAVQPWVVPDPLRRGEPMAERRRRLGEAGEAMLPLGDGPPCARPNVAGPCKGGQVEGVLWRDVEVARAPQRRPQPRRKLVGTPFDVNRPVAASRHAQRNVSLAGRGDRVWAAFEERNRVYVVCSNDGGRTWGRRVGLGRGWWPSIDAGPGDRVWLAWQDAKGGAPRARIAVSRDGGRTFTAPRALDAAPPAGVAQRRPSVAATGPNSAFAAWIDERERSADDRIPQAHVFGARLRADGSPAEPGRRLDLLAPVELARKLDHAWAPDVTARGRRVAVTWIDFRTYDWRPYLRVSRDGGGTFGPERAITDAPLPTAERPEEESLADAPRAVFSPEGRPRAVFVDYRKRDTAQRPHQLYDIHAWGFGAANRQVDPWGSRQLSSFAPAAAYRGTELFVAWQDHRHGTGEIVMRRLGPTGRPVGKLYRVSDKGQRGGNAWRPDLVAAGDDRLLAAWEDERDGPRQIFAAGLSFARLR